jgi:general secretion pathway protein I
MTNALPAPQAQGFSLIEALVALLVLAIATVGLVRTTETHVDSTRATERRMAALWVAENRLAELNLGGAAVGGREVEMLGTTWLVAVERQGTDDPAIERVTVRVTAQGERSPTGSLDGFVDTGRG